MMTSNRPLEDWEYPDGDDADDDDEESRTKPCPMCGMDVYEDAEKCPLCGEFFTRQPGEVRRDQKSVPCRTVCTGGSPDASH